jgi:hypothetical protein
MATGGLFLQLALVGYLAQNQALGAAVIVVVLGGPILTYIIARKRKGRIRLFAFISLVLLFGMILVPVIPLGGATECHYQDCHTEFTYGSVSWMFVCAGAEWTTPPGGVSTGLPSFPININSSLGNYFFAQCVYF